MVKGEHLEHTEVVFGEQGHREGFWGLVLLKGDALRTWKRLL